MDPPDGMDADWYEDPLGRYDGRFFDGQGWTERVSSDGTSQVDPDFPPVFDNPAAAVAPVRRELPRHATTAAESPVRTVAVLDDTDLASPAPAVQPSRSRQNGWRWLLLGLAAAAAALIIFAISRGNSDEPSAAEADIVERVEDLESGGLPDTQTAADAEALDVDVTESSVDTTATFAPEDAIQLGDFRILNGAPMLEELAEWHRGYASERDIELGANAGCWFGQIGDAAVGVVQCGPIAGDTSADYQYDLVPVDFVAAGDDIVVRPGLDRVTPNAVVANALELVGYPGGPVPPQ